MGTFHVVVQATGNHGCERELKDDETVIGCDRPGCTDCMAREFVRRLKRSGAQVHLAQIDHWPQLERIGENPLPPTGQVQDDLVSGKRTGNF